MSAFEINEAPGGGMAALPGSGWQRWQQEDLLTELLKSLHGVRAGRVLASRLMVRFGSLPETLSATTTRLMEVEGVDGRTAAHLHLILEASRRLARETIDPALPILSSWPQLIDYLRVAMAYDTIERFRILFLDKKNRLIADEVQQTGTIDHTPVYPREVIKRSLELSATALILVHNHPSGDPAPSSADVRMTKEISDVGKAMGITLHDHIIVGKSGLTSLRTLKLL
jgi:DNA repair protein RadC